MPVELTVEDNWWSNGPTGPCGPDSEIFLWTGDTPPRSTPTNDDRWVEVWNHVMMCHRRLDDGSLVPLGRHNVDTGLGLERLSSLLQGHSSVFECDVFEPWRRIVPGLWLLDERSLRLVCDHLRSAVVVIGDGVRPSNTGRGYVLRRLVRRMLTVLRRDDPSRSLVDLPDELVEHTLHPRTQYDGARAAAPPPTLGIGPAASCCARRTVDRPAARGRRGCAASWCCWSPWPAWWSRPRVCGGDWPTAAPCGSSVCCLQWLPR